MFSIKGTYRNVNRRLLTLFVIIICKRISLKDGLSDCDMFNQHKTLINLEPVALYSIEKWGLVKSVFHTQKSVCRRKIGKHVKHERTGIYYYYVIRDIVAWGLVYCFLMLYHAFSHHRYCDNLGEYITVCYDHKLFFHLVSCLLTFILYLVEICQY